MKVGAGQVAADAAALQRRSMQGMGWMVALALLAVMLAGMGVGFTNVVLGRQVALVHTIDLIRGSLSELEDKMEAVNGDSSNIFHGVDQLLSAQQQRVDGAMHQDDLEVNAWLRGKAEDHWLQDLEELQNQLHLWREKVASGEAPSAIIEYSRKSLHAVHAIVEDVDSDVRKALVVSGRVLYLINIVTLSALLALVVLALFYQYRQRRSAASRIAEMEQMVEKHTARLQSTLEENQSQLQAIMTANARMESFHKARDGLAIAAQELFWSGDYTQFYGRIVEDVMRVSGARYGAFALFDGQGKILEFITRGIADEVMQVLGQPPEGRGLLRSIYHEKKPVRVDDIAADSRACGFPPGHPPMHSLLGLPLVVDGETRGAIYLADKEGGKPFAEEDRTLLEIYSNEVAHALQRQNLLTLLQQDNIKRQAVEEQLSKVKTRYQSLIENSPAVIYTAHPADHSPTFVSNNVERILGYRAMDFVGDAQNWINRVHPQDVPGVMAEIGDLGRVGVKAVEFRFLLSDGSYHWLRNNLRMVCNDAGEPVEILGVVTDITESKAAEEEVRKQQAILLETNRRLEEAHSQLLQSEKMAAIGQLAAGVAHEINNPVGYINSNIGTLQGYAEQLFRVLEAYGQIEAAVPETSQAMTQLKAVKQEADLTYLKQDVMDLLRESQEGVNRVRQIVRDLKDFSHVDEQEWVWADLRQGLDSTLNIVHNEIKYKAQVVKEYGDIPQIECRPHQLNQVFMNLLVNAAHAIADRGTIHVRTGAEQDWVWVEIEDTGHGIAPEHLNRIFDPFFTTKPVGKGTGLGLSLSYGIVHRHGGRIEVDSTVGKGTRFRVWLPRQRAAEAAEEI